MVEGPRHGWWLCIRMSGWLDCDQISERGNSATPNNCFVSITSRDKVDGPMLLSLSPHNTQSWYSDRRDSSEGWDGQLLSAVAIKGVQVLTGLRGPKSSICTGAFIGTLAHTVCAWSITDFIALRKTYSRTPTSRPLIPTLSTPGLRMMPIVDRPLCVSTEDASFPSAHEDRTSRSSLSYQDCIWETGPF